MIFDSVLAQASMEPSILDQYLHTFGFAMVGMISMGIALIITLKIFTVSTTKIDEWGEIKNGNMAVAVVMATVILSLALVVMAIVGN